MKLYAVALIALSACTPTVSAGVYGDDRGARPEALDPCDALYDKGDRVQARACYSGLLESPDLFVRAEAWWGLDNFKQANDVFREALKAQPENADLRVRWGYLYEQTYNPEEAVQLFREALEIDADNVPAQIGIAMVMAKHGVVPAPPAR